MWLYSTHKILNIFFFSAENEWKWAKNQSSHSNGVLTEGWMKNFPKFKFKIDSEWRKKTRKRWPFVMIEIWVLEYSLYVLFFNNFTNVHCSGGVIPFFRTTTGIFQKKKRKRIFFLTLEHFPTDINLWVKTMV